MSKSPIIIILNSDEGEPIDNLKLENAKSLLNQDTKILQIPLKFEEELIGLSNQEIDDFRNELGIENETLILVQSDLSSIEGENFPSIEEQTD